MDNIIKFPTTTEKEFVSGTKLAREEFTRMKTTEENLNWRLNFTDWHKYPLSENDVELVALYGDCMKLTPIVSARLNAKLAEILCKIKYE
tara:strand:+ start:7025 stop:7294 length:270 start_codon:yes stop_codon:yes gene_type:complete